jgi:hypothetical protein
MIPYLTIVFIFLAGMFKAVADTLADHFYISVFKKKDPKFWDKSISWKYAKYLPLTKYKVDAWHLANTGMIVSICAAIATKPDFSLHWAFQFIAAGIIFNLSFNIFYNKILR